MKHTAAAREKTMRAARGLLITFVHAPRNPLAPAKENRFPFSSASTLIGIPFASVLFMFSLQGSVFSLRCSIRPVSALIHPRPWRKLCLRALCFNLLVVVFL